MLHWWSNLHLPVPGRQSSSGGPWTAHGAAGWGSCGLSLTLRRPRVPGPGRGSLSHAWGPLEYYDHLCSHRGHQELHPWMNSIMSLDWHSLAHDHHSGSVWSHMRLESTPLPRSVDAQTTTTAHLCRELGWRHPDRVEVHLAIEACSWLLLPPEGEEVRCHCNWRDKVLLKEKLTYFWSQLPKPFSFVNARY